jgi:hypothetical protein
MEWIGRGPARGCRPTLDATSALAAGGNALGLDLLLLDRLRDLLLIGDDVRVEPHPPLGDGLLVDDDLLHMVV